MQGLPPATASVALPREADAGAHIETSPILPQALFCWWVRRTPRLYPIAQIMISLRLYALLGTGERPSTFLIYQYDVAGVSYEASQDVTYLRQLINLHSCRLGLPTSVRYDPHNPGNSIVLSERWMGLRQ